MTELSPRAVIDTNVVSFLFKKDDTRAYLYKQDLLGKQLIISFMTVAELKLWALSRNWGAARITKMEEHLRQFIVYPVDVRLIDLWAQVVSQGRKTGHAIDSQDAWIAATALSEGIPLITHNRKDFEWLPKYRNLFC